MYIKRREEKLLETTLIASINRKEYLEGLLREFPTSRNKALVREAKSDCMNACKKLHDFYCGVEDSNGY